MAGFRRVDWQEIRKYRVAYFLILPSVLFFAAIVLYPIVHGVYMSLFRYTRGRAPVFVGFHNYNEIFNDPFFSVAMRNTGLWAVVVVVFTSVIALLTALVLNEEFFGRSVVRTFILIPWIVPGTAAAVTWGLIYHDRYGYLNHLLVNVLSLDAFRNFAWLGSMETSLWAVMVVQIWKVYPFFCFAYVAALQTIPAELHEAARVDGANYGQRFLHVVLPGIRRIFLTLVLLNSIWTFKAFGLLYVMTRGGPYHSSEIIGIYSWLTTFEYDLPGRGAAAGSVMALILLLFVVAYVRLALRKDDDA